MNPNVIYACSLASLILVDESLDITADKISAILNAAKIDFVPPIVPGLFAKVLSNNPRQLILHMQNHISPVTQVAVNDTIVNSESQAEVTDGSSSESDEEPLFELFD